LRPLDGDGVIFEKIRKIRLPHFPGDHLSRFVSFIILHPKKKLFRSKYFRSQKKKIQVVATGGPEASLSPAATT
jgi:hypothetical protein